MFCQCYFSSCPAAHASHDGHGAMERYCRFNRALTVNRGSFGKTQLLGVKFWMAGDLALTFPANSTTGRWCISIHRSRKIAAMPLQ